MGTLTKNERDGLDEVFLAIQTHSEKYKQIKEISALLLSHKSSFNLANLLHQAKHGLKETKLSHFLLKMSKKKKNLSK